MRRTVEAWCFSFFLSNVVEAANRSALPRELWEEIYKRLPMSDRIRFASVSNKFFSISAAITTKPLDPWLMFRGKNKFWSLLSVQKRFYRFDSIIPPKTHKILGASDGWVLIITEHSGPEKPLILVNPISNAKVMLPPIEYTQVKDMKKLVVVTFGDSVVPAGVFIRTQADYLITCTCDNGRWDCSGGFSDDVMFYNGKMFNMRTREEDTYATITVSSLNEQLNHHREEHTYVVQDEGILGGMSEACLVESCGDVVLAKRFLDYRKGFEVFTLLLVDEDSSARCVKLERLEGQALFWGRDGCISVPVGKYSLFEENHIYFSVQKEDLSYKIGVYSLKDKSFKQIHNLPKKTSRQEATWFFPKIKNSFVNRIG